MSTASSLSSLWDRAAEWRCRLSMIQEASEFIYLSTFYIEYDRYGIELLDALFEAQHRGVKVNLLVDGLGQRLGGVLMTAQLRATLDGRLKALRNAGATVTIYRPAYFLQRLLQGGQHVKIQVSEKGEALFGSSNITRSSFEGWNEYSVSLNGPIVPILLESYREIGGKVEDRHLHKLHEITQTSTPVGTSIDLDYWLYNPNRHQGQRGVIGWRGRNLVTDRIINMLKEAQKTIELTSFFFKPTPILMQAIVEAAHRGVQVDVFHSHPDALPVTDLAWIASATSYERLLNAGIRIYENRHGEHSKIVLVDHNRVAFGSYNFEDAAHDRLAEAMLATSDARAIRPAVSIFRELRKDPDNQPVTTKTLRTLPRRLKRRLALFGRFKRWM